MKLIHYASKPLPLILDNREQAIHMKPEGLWLSVEGEDDWPHWCQSESFHIDQLAIAQEVRLADDARVIRLACASDIDTFTREWTTALRGGPDYLGQFIDWPGVAREYDGIIISPYIWSRRLSDHCFWYYGWDCASGCVWRVSAIAEIARPIEAKLCA